MEGRLIKPSRGGWGGGHRSQSLRDLVTLQSQSSSSHGILVLHSLSPHAVQGPSSPRYMMLPTLRVDPPISINPAKKSPPSHAHRSI